jgi:hypothetical protein
MIGAIAWFVMGHLEDFKALWRQPPPGQILALLPLSWLLMIGCNSELIRQPLTAYGLRLSITEALALTTATTAVNYVVPLKGGQGLKGLYLTTTRGQTVSDFLAMLGSITAMTLTTASFFAFLGLLWLWGRGYQPGPLLPAYFGGSALLGLAAVLFLGRLPFRLPKRLLNLAKGWDRLRADQGLFLRLTLLQVAYFIAWAWYNWLALAAFEVRLGPAEIVLYCGGQIHATIVNLTPAGLGIVEAFSVYAGRVMDFSPAQALSAQALNRLTAVAMLAITGLWGWLHLASLIRRSKTFSRKPDF